MTKSLLQQDFLIKIINSANEGIYVTDKDRRFVIWNKRAEMISGYQSDEVIGKFCQDNLLDHADSKGKSLCKTHCPLHHSVEHNCSCGPEIVYLRHKDGRRIPVEVSTSPIVDEEGNVIGGVELFEDVSIRIENERHLIEKTQKLEAVLNNIREGVIFLDGSGSVNLYNKALTEMLDLDDDLKGKNIFLLSSNHLLRQVVFRVDKSYKGPHCWEVNHCHAEGACYLNGSEFCRCWIFSRDLKMRSHILCMDCPAYKKVKRFLEVSKELEIGSRTISALSSFLEFRDKNEIWEVLVFRDVTTEKLDAVMKLARGAAHELRQPLQAIIGAVALLADELTDMKDSAKYLGALEDSCFRLNDIVTKIGQITSYRTKSYAEEINFLDIDRSSKKKAKKRD